MEDQVKPKQKQLGKTKKELKQRAKIIASELINGATKSAACITAGYSPTYAIQNAGKIIEHPLIQQTFRKLLEDAGLTDEALAAKINSLVNAKETKFFTHQGEVVETREVEALTIQADMTKFAAGLMGHKGAGERPTQGNSYIDLSTINVQINSSSAKAGLELDTQGIDIID